MVTTSVWGMFSAEVFYSMLLHQEIEFATIFVLRGSSTPLRNVGINLQCYIIHEPRVDRVNYDNHLNGNFCRLYMSLELHVTEPITLPHQDLGHL